MKKTISLLLLTGFILFFGACQSDDATNEMALFAVPIVASMDDIREGITVEAARQTASEGKIYVAEHYLFYIAKEEGIHIFDNTDPSAPANIAFINLEGVHDIAVKGNYLYADNYIDLVVFDISNIQNISLEQTLPNVIAFNPEYPEDAAYYDYTVTPGVGEIVVGYEFEMRPIPEDQGWTVDDALGNFEGAPSNGAVGIGGSYARFQINKNALYTVDSYQLNVFNIAVPTAIVFDQSVNMTQWFGGEFETLFLQGDYLFVGATTGMYVVDAQNEFNPYFISGFDHATACDPVVVNGNTAYITVRGGTTCGAIDDQVNVIDVSDINNPSLLSTYLLNQPYGLGIKEQTLFVCCGSDGLKVFDASNPNALVLQNTYTLNVTDVIPLDSHLIVVGPNQITQYSYGTGFTLQQLSVVNF